MKDSLGGHKIQKIKTPYKISVSLSLSLSLSHTHTHIQPHSLRNLVQICLQKTWTEKQIIKNTENHSICIYCGNCFGKILETTPKKMANMKNLTMGEMRLLFIHTRVQYLRLNYLDEEIWMSSNTSHYVITVK